MTPSEASDLRATLAALPKIELHRHLEGSVRLSTLVEVAHQYHLDLPTYEMEKLRPYVQIMPDSPATVEHFLSKFNLLRRFYCAPEVIQRVVREAIEDAAADNIRYMELRFTPKALARQMNFPFADVVDWVCEAAEEAQRTCNIRVRLIISPNRHESAIEGQQAIQIAMERRERGIVGIDLCGQEEGYPINPFIGAFREARQEGLQVTMHAGEWAGPHNIRDAIEALGATRIGHGVRIFEDQRIVDLALEHGISFEVCPTSNLHSGVVRSLEQHPLRTMHAHQLKTTLNTDDPSICNITLTDELYRAVTLLGFTLDDVKRTLINAAQCAFLPDDARAELVAYFTEALGPEPKATQTHDKQSYDPDR